MIFIIRKRHIAAAVVLCVALLAAVLVEGHGGAAQVFAQVFAPRTQAPGRIVVLDPGHGGEDGGAVSGVFIAAPEPARGCQSGGFGDTDKIKGKVALRRFHKGHIALQKI